MHIIINKKKTPSPIDVSTPPNVISIPAELLFKFTVVQSRHSHHHWAGPCPPVPASGTLKSTLGLTLSSLAISAKPIAHEPRRRAHSSCYIGHWDMETIVRERATTTTTKNTKNKRKKMNWAEYVLSRRFSVARQIVAFTWLLRFNVQASYLLSI